jgi:hypothetical protein
MPASVPQPLDCELTLNIVLFFRRQKGSSYENQVHCRACRQSAHFCV